MKALFAAIGLTGALAASPAGATTLSLLPGNALFSSYVTNAADVNSISLVTGASGLGGSPTAQEFTSSVYTSLQSLTLRLSDATPSDGGSLLVYLTSNNSTPSLNIPSSTGLQLTNSTLLGSILDSSLSATASNVTLSVWANLAPGTYWISLVNGSDTNNGGTNPNSTNALWYRAGDMIGLDVGNNVNNTDAGLYNAHVKPNATVLSSVNTNVLEMQINTPEPASLLLLSTGMLGLGFASRRLSKKAAQ